MGSIVECLIPGQLVSDFPIIEHLDFNTSLYCEEHHKLFSSQDHCCMTFPSLDHYGTHWLKDHWCLALHHGEHHGVIYFKVIGDWPSHHREYLGCLISSPRDILLSQPYHAFFLLWEYCGTCWFCCSKWVRFWTMVQKAAGGSRAIKQMLTTQVFASCIVQIEEIKVYVVLTKPRATRMIIIQWPYTNMAKYGRGQMESDVIRERTTFLRKFLEWSYYVHVSGCCMAGFSELKHSLREGEGSWWNSGHKQTSQMWARRKLQNSRKPLLSFIKAVIG